MARSRLKRFQQSQLCLISETIDAVANGILDGDFNAIAYFSGRDPAFAIMGDLIAGFDTPDQYQDYCMHGGGKEMLQKIYFLCFPVENLRLLGCGPIWERSLCCQGTTLWR